MPYLEPPPFPAPVIVQKDVGGYVADYRAATERYRAEDREVQLGECRSACTLALSLPGVCVWPSSVVKFHKAYDAKTKVVDEGVSQELFNAYPPAVRARLGTLTRNYQVLTGTELISLGLRNCAESRTMMAKRLGTQPTLVAAAAPGPQAPVSPSIGAMFQSVLTAVAKPFEEVTSQPATPAVAALAVPLPPRRPAGLETPQMMPASLVVAQVEARDLPRSAHSPLPDQVLLPVPGLPRLIAGAQPVLPSGAFSLRPWAGR